MAARKAPVSKAPPSRAPAPRAPAPRTPQGVPILDAASPLATVSRLPLPAGVGQPGRGRRCALAAPPARLSFTDQAYQAIKSKILSFELRPGQFLNEAALCEVTGLGRTPVHQAAQRLQAEGLIEVIPRKGLVIRMDSLNDILVLLEARMTMEPNIVALAAERLGAGQIDELRGLLDESRGLLDQQRQREAFSAIDRAFHRVVAEGSGNPILVDTLRPLHERSDLIWHLRIMPADGLEVTQREHEAVLAAIVARDAEGARRAMHAHLMSLYKRVLKASMT